MGLIIDPYKFVTIASDYFETLTWTTGGTGVAITGGQCVETAASSNSWNYVVAPLPSTLSNTTWSFNFDFIFSASVYDINGFGLLFTAGTIDPIGSQDMLGMNKRVGSNNQMVLGTVSKDGAGALSYGAQNLTLSINTQYYCTIERTSATNLRLSIFTNESRTTHLTNSPQNTTISSGIIDLTHVMVTTHSNEGGGSVTDITDNLKVVS